MTTAESSQQAAALTLDQALQQAIVHHQAGQAQDAERLYRAILQVQPNHPDANHNLGVLAVQEKRPSAGLPYFMAALEADPARGQYWLSYIDALFQAGQLEAARQVLAHARQQGLQGDALEVLAGCLEGGAEVTKQSNAERQHAFQEPPPLSSAAPDNTPKTAPEKKGKSARNHVPHKGGNPSPQEINTLVALFTGGRYTEAATLAQAMTERFPRHGFGWKVLGAVFKQMGRATDALASMQKAAALLPGDAEAHNNLGVTFKDMNRLEEAEASYRRALQIKPDYAEAHYNLGNILKDMGRLDEAEASYRRALEIRPRYPDAHYNLGNMLNDLGRMDEAGVCYQRVLQIKPDYAEAHSNLGNVLKNLGRLEEAEASYRRALLIKPDFAETHSNLGNILKNLGRLGEAEASHRRALQIKPDYADAYNNLGAIFHDLGRLDEAEANYRRALQIRPDYAEAHYNLGITLNDLSRLDEAEASYRRVLEIKPDFAEAHNSLGISLHDMGRLDGAEASYRRALELKSGLAEAHNNLGITLHDMGRLDEAEASYRRALESKPDYAEAHSNLGSTLHDLGRLAEAEAICRRALEIKPDFAEAHCNLGSILSDMGRLDEAEASYRQALQIKPDFAEARNYLGITLQNLGRLEEAEASCRRALEIKPDYIDARSSRLFSLNYIASNAPSYCLAEACHYGRKVSNKITARFVGWSCAKQPERLRVGLVSGDFRNHPVGYFLESLLAQIDPASVELIAYPTDLKADELTTRIKPYFSAWKPLVGQSDKAASRLIHSDGIHVLMDLSGHTRYNRLPMFAWKPAPVQVSWLGYFATTGVPEIDYLLGDRYVTPDDEASHFTEELWQLPGCYLCFTEPNVALEVASLPALSAGNITFGCFNNLTKMNDAVVVVWANILKAVPGSKLFLKTKQLNEAMCGTTLQRFAGHGITADRLILESASPRDELLASYHRVDIALDPFPYPGGTTSAEGLWMGVPVITKRGDRFLSHVGETIAHNVGLSGWVAVDEDDYVAKAVAYASDLDKLAKLRAGLRQQVLASPLFDAARFARHFEETMWQMWSRWFEQRGGA